MCISYKSNEYRTWFTHHKFQLQPEEEVVEKEPEIEDLPPILFKGYINYVSDFYDCASVCDTIL